MEFRRVLFRSIPLQHRYSSKSLVDQIMGLVAYLLRAAYDELQAGKFVGLRRPCVLVEEGVGGEQDRGAGLLDQGRDLFGVKGGGILKRLHSGEQGER